MEISSKLIQGRLMGMDKHSQNSENCKFQMPLQYHITTDKDCLLPVDKH